MLADVARALTDAGFACQCCTTAEMALAKARLAPPDLIISGTMVNGRSAAPLCQQIRQEHGLHHVPLMLLSKNQIPDIIRRSHEAGGTYYVRQPVDLDMLVELVFSALWIPHNLPHHMRPLQSVGVN